MSTRLHRTRIAGALCAALGLIVTTVPAASAHSSSDASWYVAVGDSLSAGYQPGQGNDPDGGFVGGVLSGAQQKFPGIKLENLACSGERTPGMITGTGSPCTYPEGSQLKATEAFLRAHPGKVKLVTVTIGANDVQTCVKGGVINQTCLAAGLNDVAKNVPTIMKRLRAAAPKATITIGTYYNPFLAAWLAGEDGQQLAKISSPLQVIVNSLIGWGAFTGHANVARVDTAFASHDWRTVSAPGLGEVPRNVATICQLTWMCLKQDIHANDQGYAVIATAFRKASRLP